MILHNFPRFDENIVEVATLLGVREFLIPEELGFSVLFDKSEDCNALVLDRDATAGNAQGCPLLALYQT